MLYQLSYIGSKSLTVSSQQTSAAEAADHSALGGTAEAVPFLNTELLLGILVGVQHVVTAQHRLHGK